MTVGGKAHWDSRYDTIEPACVAWYQERPIASLGLLAALGIEADQSVIDVGGGASNLVDHLLMQGHTDLTVLDLSSVALDAARARVGANPAVEWLDQDLLSWTPARTWDVWHDRAVLHFLIGDDDRQRYVATLERALRPGGAFVIGTFAEDGPTECSALPVRRYSAADLRDLLGDVEVLRERREVHVTPNAESQPFNWIAGRLPSGNSDG